MTATMASSADSQTTDIPRKTVSKTSEHRRATKPIMEKKRRARINNSLNELKVLILDALNKDPSRHSKLEKADILEMTVRHLQSVQRQQMATAISTDPSVLNKYRAGFNECATEVGRYINRIDGVDTTLRQRVVNHLNVCVQSINTAANMTSNSYATPSRSGNAFPGMNPPFASSNTPLHVQIPLPAAIAAGIFPNSGLTNICSNSGDINNNMTSPMMTTRLTHDSKVNMQTPPSSASSTASSHFTFSLPLQCSPPINSHLMSFHHNLNQSSGMAYRHGSTGSWSHNSYLESPLGQSSISPVGSATSEQLSPSGSEQDVDMVFESHSGSAHHSLNSDSVWRPW
ncbi:transcription factor HES-4-like [Oppia nitens]|uniref:transcription factor HES-4-like n=1 Tax=Oppia nitens TaxID=1686743 RepID=UPI0023DC39E0|nr:transcription factor HES-4-like [Oppia nitens]